ncbi:hypothetical protein [Bacillus sp. FJAT-50079]|nr:hypothetical protein [Bacillus sp. FJAT-50079]
MALHAEQKGNYFAVTEKVKRTPSLIWTVFFDAFKEEMAINCL